MRRVFFGLAIPANIQQHLLQVRAEVAGASWQRAEQLHLTSLFLGDLNDELLQAIRAAARQVHLAPFTLQVSTLGCFGTPHTPKHLWAGVKPKEAVTHLHEALKNQAQHAGLPTEHRTYCPHITLARFNRKPGSVAPLLAEYSATKFGSFTVNEFLLYESQPNPEGSVYTVLERYPLVAP